MRRPETMEEWCIYSYIIGLGEIPYHRCKLLEKECPYVGTEEKYCEEYEGYDK